MKLMGSIFLLLAALQAFAQMVHPAQNQENKFLRGTLKPRDFGLDNTLKERLLSNALASERDTLREAKFMILNGETELARQALARALKTEKGPLRAMTYRYLATLEFQDGRWVRALEHLQRRELSLYPHYAKVCQLKVLLRIAVRDVQELPKEWQRCRNENAKDLASKDVPWMDTLVIMATNPPKGTVAQGIRRTSFRSLSNDEIRSMLKLALYLNLETLLIDQLELLDYDAIQDEELRSLVAHVYFRQGKLAEAWRYMQDISNPNVENMKGNIWLLRGNQELAYAQFKLALKQKSNSHNAVERALPLAWSLKQWQEGVKLSERIYTHEKNRLQKFTTTAAFAVAQGQWPVALSLLETVHQEAGVGTALEVSQLSTYVALRQHDQKRLERYARLACEAGDLMACWIRLTRLQQDDVSRLVDRDDSAAPAEFLWRKLASEDVVEFKEENLVDQRDVDELDDALIKL